MRLRGWHVEGFGLLRDFRVEGLPDGLTVVLGPNEAGKTSLLAFLRGALFGFPKGRMRDRQYPPLRGGRHGGRLLLECDGATWTVERFASPAHFALTRPDGTPAADADLRGLVGGVDADLHRNVFAFSLTELQEFGTLQTDGVRDRIFAAGVVGAGRSARAAIDAFAAERAAIGRKFGACRIQTLRKRAEELDEQLRLARARAAKHPELRRTADELDAEQKRIGGELSDARRELARLDALLAAWPDWDERTQAETELAAAPAVPDLPGDLERRLDAALAARQARGERADERERAVQDLGRTLDALVPDDRLAAMAPEARRLANRAGSARERRDRLAALAVKRDALARRVREEAQRLGPDWTPERVRAFDASLPAAQEIADIGERLRAADEAAAQTADAAAQQAEALRRTEAGIAQRMEALRAAAPVPDAAELAERDAAVRKLRVRLTELATARADLRSASVRAEDAARRAAEAQQTSASLRDEAGRRGLSLRDAPPLPAVADLDRRERAVRDLRAALADLAAARAESRIAGQRAIDARRTADDAAGTAAARETEAERRAETLARAFAVPDAETLAALDRAVRELRAGVARLAVLRSEARAAEIRLADLRADADRRAAAPPPADLRRPMLLAAVVLVLAAAVLAVLGQLVAAGVAFAAAVAAAIFAAFSRASPGPDADVTTGVATAERDADEARKNVSETEAVVSRIAARLGISGVPDPAGADACADDIASRMRARENRDRETAAVEALRTGARVSRDAAQRLGNVASAAESDASAAAQRVRDSEDAALALVRPLGFPEIPSAAALEERAAEVAASREQVRDRERATAEVARLGTEAGRALQTAARLTEEAAALRAEIEDTRRPRATAAEDAVRAVSVPLGLGAAPDAADVEAAAESVDRGLRARGDRDRDIAGLGELHRARDTETAAVRRAEEAAATRRAESEAEREGWSAWKREHGCPAALRPEIARQFFDSVGRVRDALEGLDALDAEAAALADDARLFGEAVDAAWVRAGGTRIADVSAEDAAEALRDRADADSKLRGERTRLGKELERARTDLADAVRERDEAAAGLAVVLAEAGAADERDCRARIAASRHAADLRRRAREAEQRLRQRLGIGAQADAVRAELPRGDRPGWDARRQECKATLAQLQPASEDAVRRHQTALESLSALERECEVVALAAEREGVVAEIREALAEWRVLAIAESLVQGTLRRYEVERQPAVLARAAASFRRITDGRYVRLVPREDGIDVLAEDGGRVDAAALSRGTAEQLYLCLRLALAAEFAQHAVSLPLVMDDVLVNFDPGRARLAAQVLLDATAGHQVLLFTCHPETVELLRSVAPDTCVLTLDRALPAVAADAAAAGLPPRSPLRDLHRTSLPDAPRATPGSDPATVAAPALPHAPRVGPDGGPDPASDAEDPTGPTRDPGNDRSSGNLLFPLPSAGVTPAPPAPPRPGHSDAALEDAVLAAIRGAGRPLSRGELVAVAGVPEARWSVVIQSLRARGVVVMHGRKRGSTWGLPEWAAAAQADEPG